MKQNPYKSMHVKIAGMVAEAAAASDQSASDLSKLLGYGDDYLRKKVATGTLPELRMKDVLLLAQMSGRQIKIVEVAS